LKFGDEISPLTTVLTSVNESDGQKSILELSEQMKVSGSFKSKHLTSTFFSGDLAYKNTAKNLSDFVEAIKVAPAKDNKKFLTPKGNKYYG
jgi:hypothetical protein